LLQNNYKEFTMNALFIDDNSDSIAPAMDVFQKNGVKCQNMSFDEYNPTTTTEKPDIIVLDMMNGGATEDPTGNSGNSIYSQIWKDSFCPIIIYSANPDLSNAPDHPFIRKVEKGTGSESVVWDEAVKFEPYLLQRTNLYHEFDSVLNKTLRDTAPAIFPLVACDKEEIFLRVTRRRIAAEMDRGLDSEVSLKPYEQYIFPVVGNDWLQGDIVKYKKDGSFFLVLTPSCDLVKRSGKIKAGTILCAKCCSFDRSLIAPFLKAKKTNDCEMCKSEHCGKNKPTCDSQKKQLFHDQKVNEFTSLLNAGIVGKYFVLPKIGMVIPDLLANLKDFHLITTAQMDDYERIVSIDSPFREQLSWVFVSIAGRPGMPDRDFSTWASENI
jgi:hypothetical protein